MPHRFRVAHLDETTSTNAVALDAATAGEREGLVVVADHQSAGRGRRGRSWSAPAGTALLMSVLLRPPPDALHAAVSALSCAAAAACGRAGYEPGLKWPNDLVAGSAKLGGILAESVTTPQNVTVLVVGLGLNVTPPSDRPADIAAVAADLAVLCAGAGSATIDRAWLLEAVLCELEPRYQALLDAGPSAILEEYRRRCVTIGRQVRVTHPRQTWEGIAVAIADDGSLIVERAAGAPVRVEVGDVVHLTPV